MQECDWTGTAAAVTALALTAGVWLWPADDASHANTKAAATAAHHPWTAERDSRDDDMARWRAEARRWDGGAGQVQLSAAGTAETTAPVLR